MSSYNQSDKPPQWDRRFVNAIGVMIALVTIIAPLAAITVSSLTSEAEQPLYNPLLSD